MSENPQPPEDPEQEGIPDYAVDTSTAYDEADRPRFDDSPPSLPAEESQALDERGTTGTESRQREPLADRLARESPDVAGRPAEPEPDLSAEVVTEGMAAQVASDAEGLGAESGLEPEPGGQPSEALDAPETAPRVGRLEDPDHGSYRDTEKDQVATDRGEAGGGAAPEEAAMHEVDEDEFPDQR